MEHFKKSENVNIFFKNDQDRESLNKTASPYEKYIILMNETLQMENREHLALNKKIEAELAESQEENDKLDTSCRYMRGLLKNLVELEKLKSTTCTALTKINSSYETKFCKDKINIGKYAMMYEIIMVILLAGLLQVYFLDFYQFLLLVIFMTGNSFFVRTVFVKKFDLPTCANEKAEITETNAKIKKLKDGTDYLHEYIDSL
jgi:hypothetical protein